MSACCLCCLFHCLILCAVFLRCVDSLSCFVIGLRGLFLHVHCFFLNLFLCPLVLFFLISDCDLHFFLCSLLFKAVSVFVEDSLCAVCSLLIVVSLVVSKSICLEVAVVCCVIDASLPYTHTRPENFPIQEVKALQLHFWRLFGHLSLFFLIDYTFFPPFL